MIIQFTLQELMFFLLGALGIAAGFILLSILWNIKKMVGVLRSLLESKLEVIQKTIGIMPGILENVGHISSNVRDTTDRLKVSTPVILQEVEYVANAAKGSIESVGAIAPNFMVYLHILEEVLQIIYRTFSRSK